MKRLIAVIAVLVSATVWAEEEIQSPNDPAVLWSQATLYRDEWGVPHIYADNLRAMAFAFGFAQAEDHLDAMLLAFRAVQGRSAEVVGESRLPQDTYALQMRFDELAKAAFETAERDLRDLCEGFALGVNTWLLEHTEQAPEWAEGIRPHEVLSLLHAFLMAHAPFDLPEADVRDRGMLSANAWAVSPEHSTTSQAMLVINPHAEFDGIYRWYEAHLVADGYDVAGATIYGLPLLLVGHNASYGWGISPNGADIADLFDEENFKHLNHSERYHDVFVKTPEGLEKRTVTTWWSDNGPIVATNVGRPLAWKVGGYGNFDTLPQLLAMGSALSLDDFIAALNVNAFPSFNVVYADLEGNIYYVYNAVTAQRPAQPIRASDDAERTIWEKPVPGYSSGFRWGEPLDESLLPTLVNPGAGYIVGSGTPPWMAATDAPYASKVDLSWLVRDQDSPSAVRVRDLFDRGPRSFNDVQSLLFDHAIPGAGESVQFLLEAAQANPVAVRDGHADLPAALDNLAEWDLVAGVESTAMTYFHIWSNLYQKVREKLPQEIAEDALQKIAVEAASEAVRLLVNTYQTPFVPWGDVHTLSRGELELPLAGATTGEPVFRSGDANYDGGKWRADSGYAYAMIVQFSDPPTTISLVPFGSSDREESPHYADQMLLLSERRMKVLHTAHSDVIRGATSARGTYLEFLDVSGRARVTVSSVATLEGRLVTAHRFDRRTEDGLAAFSPFVEPVISPGEEDITIDFEFLIPDSICAVDDIGELTVYAFHPQTGWAIVEEQSIDPESRTLAARDYYDQVYVVLGPEQYLRRDPVVSPEQSALSDIPLQLMPEIARAPRASKAPEPAEDPIAIAMEQPAERQAPEPLQTSRPEDNPFGASPGVLVFTPGGPEGGELNSDLPQVVKPELVPEAVADAPRDSQAEPVDMMEPPPESADSETGYQREVEGDTVIVRGKAEAEDTFSGGGPRLRVSYEPPSSMRGAPQAPSPFQLYLAPGSAVASQLQIGSNLDITPPREDVMLRLNARESVRAQGYIVDAPPGPLPEGLALFTPIVAARREPVSTPCTVAITLRVSPTRCNPAQAERLALYAFDEREGWVRMETATMPVPLSYQAIDLDARTYAVLGPVSLAGR